jgi:hypothetical protein
MPREKQSDTVIEGFAEDLGKLLGTAQGKAESWLGQRKEIIQHLTALRDTATRLLVDLGHEAESAVRRGRPRVEAEVAEVTRKARKLSAKGRAAIAAAQKARWAAIRAEKEKTGKKK